MVELEQREDRLDGGSQAPRAEASGFEPPALTVIGTVAELTQGIPGKIGPDMDGGLTTSLP
jgi:hypothetical protein